MAVFAIVASSNPTAMQTAVTTQYGANHFQFTSNVWFVSDVGSTKDVADKIGITDNRIGALGGVFRIDAYSGYASNAAWAWLQPFTEVRSNG